MYGLELKVGKSGKGNGNKKLEAFHTGILWTRGSLVWKLFVHKVPSLRICCSEGL